MNPPADDDAGARRGSRAGTALVAAQFALLALQGALAAPALWQGHVPALAAALLGLGSATGLWALWANRPGNFNIRPVPRQGAQLVVHGPYRWVRHPMYTALLLACAGLGVMSPPMWAAAAWVALAVVLNRKAALEEALMAQAHPGYAAYAVRTRRFVPGVL